MRKPSITKLLDLLNKPALLGWANRLGLEGIELKKRQAENKKMGNSYHNQANRFFLNHTPMENQKHQAYLNFFLKDKTVLGSEVKIETEYFTGRYDLKYLCDGKVCLCDFKSSHHVYFENRLQLVAYAMAEKCDDLVVVNAPDFTLKSIDVFDRTPYENILKKLSEIYYLKGEIGDGTKRA